MMDDFTSRAGYDLAIVAIAYGLLVGLLLSLVWTTLTIIFPDRPAAPPLATPPRRGGPAAR